MIIKEKLLTMTAIITIKQGPGITPIRVKFYRKSEAVLLKVSWGMLKLIMGYKEQNLGARIKFIYNFCLPHQQ